MPYSTLSFTLKPVCWVGCQKIFIFFLLLLWPTIAVANQQCSAVNREKGLSIMQKVDQQSKLYETQVSDVYMQVVDENDSTRTRYFKSSKKRNEQVVKSLIKFYKPANIKNTAFLTHSYTADQADVQWIYLPALRSIRQLNSSDKNKSFLGSDFTNSDIGGRNINQDQHCFIKENAKYYIVNSIPKDKADMYSKLQLLISKQIMFPVRVTFYTQKTEEKVLKILTNKKIDKFGQVFLATYAVMENKSRGTKTIIEVLSTDLAQKINDRDLGVKSLR